MSLTSYGVNDPKAVKLWSKKVFTEALKTCYASRFIGKGSDNVVQIMEETSKGPGDTITVPVRMQLTGAGVQGDGTLEGNEEALTMFNDKVVIDQLRHAVRSGGKMSQQRVPFNVRNEAKNGLVDWWAGRLDYWFFNVLAGNTAVTDTRYTGNQAVVQPDSNHRLVGDGTVGTADDAITNTMKFQLSHIDKCVELAGTLDQSTAAGLVPLRPINIMGEKKFVMFLHDYQVYDLRTNAGSGQWLDIQKAAMTGGQISKNPIYTGALGEYNNTILHKAPRVPTGVNSTTGAAVTTVRRAIFCGAQAGLMAFGQDGGPSKMDWVEELFDYKNQLGVSCGLIAGLKKTQFNNNDFGVITVSTYAAKHTP